MILDFKRYEESVYDDLCCKGDEQLRIIEASQSNNTNGKGQLCTAAIITLGVIDRIFRERKPYD
jgi:hypothetical protein